MNIIKKKSNHNLRKAEKLIFRVHYILKNTKVEGPYTRYCIWFQGCSKRCKGCWAKETWDFKKGIQFDTKDIIKDILKTKNIEGVTFLGGEPFEQYEALLEISREVHKNNLGILCFTGKNYNEIEKNYPEALKYIDLLIDGEFQEDKKDYSRPWVGSSNQNYIYLTNRYNKELVSQYKNRVEINIKKNGFIFINGMGDFSKIKEKLKLYK